MTARRLTKGDLPRSPDAPRFIAYWCDDKGWHKIRTDNPSDYLRYGYRPQQRGEISHWAICAAEKDDGGFAPPPGVPIHEEEDP